MQNSYHSFSAASAIPAIAALNVTPIEGVECDGWQVAEMGGQSRYDDTIEWVAVRGGESVLLGVSRFRFSPNQERFAWLVRNGFPAQTMRPGGATSPIDNDDIDAWIKAEGAGA